MGKTAPLQHHVEKIQSSANSRICSEKIFDLVKDLGPQHVEEFAGNPEGSSLGKVFKHEELFPRLSGALPDWSGPMTLDSLAEQADRIPGMIVDDLLLYFNNRFNPPLYHRAASYLDDLAESVNSFFFIKLPRISRLLNDDADPGSILSADTARIVPGEKQLGAMDDFICTRTKEFDMFSVFMKLFREKNSFEQQYKAAAAGILDRARETDSLTVDAYKKASVPPLLYEHFWNKKGIPGQFPGGYKELAEQLLMLSEKSYQKGLHSLESELENIENDFLKLGLRYVIDGNLMTGEKVLQQKKQSIINNAGLIHDIAINGALGVCNGDNPRYMEIMKKDFTCPGDYRETIDEISQKFTLMSEKAREQGLLALEDDLYFNDEDCEGCEDRQCENAPGSFIEMPMELMKMGMKLVVDGTDPDLVRRRMEFYGKNELSLVRQNVAAAVEGVLCVQSGELTSAVADIIGSLSSAGDDPIELIDTLSGLSELTRREGLGALEEKRADLNDGFLNFLVKMVVDEIYPDDLYDIAQETSARIIEEIDMYYSLIHAGVQFINGGVSPAVMRAALELLIPFTESQSISGIDFVDAENSMHNWRRAKGIGTGAAGAGPGIMEKKDLPGSTLFADYVQSFEKISFNAAILFMYSRYWNIENIEDFLMRLQDSIFRIMEDVWKNADGAGGLTESLHDPVSPLVSEAGLLRDSILASIKENTLLWEELFVKLSVRTESTFQDDSGALPDEIDFFNIGNNLAHYLENDDLDRLGNDCTALINKSIEEIDTDVAAYLADSGMTVRPGSPGDHGSLYSIFSLYDDVFSFQMRMHIFRKLLKVELAKEERYIFERLFIFDDVKYFDGQAIVSVLRQIDTQDLAKALSGVDEDLSDSFYNCMAPHPADLLREDINFMGPIREVDSIESRKKIMNIMSMLAATGEISLPIPESAGVNESEEENMERVFKLAKNLAKVIHKAEVDAAAGNREAAAALLDGIEKKYGMKIVRTIAVYSKPENWETVKIRKDYDKKESDASILKIYRELKKKNEDKIPGEDQQEIIWQLLDEIEKRESVHFDLYGQLVDLAPFWLNINERFKSGDGPDAEVITDWFLSSVEYYCWFSRAVLVEDIFNNIRNSYLIKSMDDLQKLSDRSLQKIIRDIDTGTWLVALHGIDDGLAKRFMSNVSIDRQAMLIEESAALNPALHEIQSAHDDIISRVIMLAESGDIAL